MKTCRLCNATKPLSNFYKDNSKKRGYVGRCKDCYRATYGGKKRFSARYVYGNTKRNAERRGISFDLTFDQYQTWIHGAPCAYCGGDGSGVDRMNNEPYYSLQNALSCCAKCNSMKSALPFSDFLSHVKRVADNLGLNTSTPALNSAT